MEDDDDDRFPPAIMALLRQALGGAGSGIRIVFNGDDDDDDDDEDDVEAEGWVTSSDDGMATGGEDTEGPSTTTGPPKPSLVSLLRTRETDAKGKALVDLRRHFVPSGKPRAAVDQNMSDLTYCGQFSSDGSMFYAATKDYKIHLYDSDNDFKKVDTIRCVPGQWTVTDCDLSRDSQTLLYSSITETVHLVNINPASERYNQHVPLLFNDDDNGFGIWSVRLSRDGREVVAGSNAGQIFVYDIEAREHLHRIRGHRDDVNAVCFADDSSNVVISGSDDAVLKIWDRRSMKDDSRAAGVLVGHTEGITYVASRGDGRYVVSNGKDQRLLIRNYGRPHFDYRYNRAPPPSPRHPHDVSVRCFQGHQVLRTLIRCHFSPDGNFVYTGSSDGRVLVFDAEGSTDPVSELKPPKARAAARNRRFFDDGVCTRDVSWHPHLPCIATTGTHSEEQTMSVKRMLLGWAGITVSGGIFLFWTKSHLDAKRREEYKRELEQSRSSS
ncbi:hypothetical protein HDU96_006450 [Phlyctochytrium bullatum]|nr:hypothetical protein HDU96_006450 [Phlyctochytrium bullatum]